MAFINSLFSKEVVVTEHGNGIGKILEDCHHGNTCVHQTKKAGEKHPNKEKI